jgi:hypothetical protein
MAYDTTNNDPYVPADGTIFYVLNAHNNITTIQHMGAAAGSIYDPLNKDVPVVNDYTDGYVTVMSS